MVARSVYATQDTRFNFILQLKLQQTWRTLWKNFLPLTPDFESQSYVATCKRVASYRVCVINFKFSCATVMKAKTYSVW